MAYTYSNEIKWWKNRAAEFDQKRAALKPVSFEHLAGAYRGSGNLNGAWMFDSSRIDDLQDNYRSLVDRSSGLIDAYSAASWPLKGAAGAGKQPTHPSVIAPTESILTAEKRNNTIANKLKDVGGAAFRHAVGGLTRVADLLSRPGYAVRHAAEGYLSAYDDPDSAGGKDITFWEGFRAFANPVLDLSVGVVGNALTGNDETYRNMWEGFTGKEKTEGNELLKTIFPEFTSDHKKWTSVLSFAVDVAYDPLSWVTLGEGSVVTGAGKAGLAGAVRLSGRKALASSMLDSTVWTRTGRAAGREALREDVALRAIRPEVKAYKAAQKETSKYGRKVSSEKWVNKQSADKVAEFKAKHEAAQARLADTRKAFEEARDSKLAENYSGMVLARKAIFNRTLGLNSYAVYSKGVRSGGISNKMAVAYLRGVNEFKGQMYEKLLSDTPDRDAFIHLWDNARGKTMSYKAGGREKLYTVPVDDYEQFVRDYIDEVMPARQIKELTKKDLKRRRATLVAEESRGLQFHNALFDNFGARANPTKASKLIPDSPTTPGSTEVVADVIDPNQLSLFDDVDFEAVADEAIDNSLARADAEKAAPSEPLSPGEIAYQEKFGYSEGAMRYRQQGIGIADKHVQAAVDVFHEQINSRLASALRGVGVDYNLTPITGTEDVKLLEIEDWSKGRNAGSSPEYNRKKHLAIASAISEAWGEAVQKAAILDEMSQGEALVHALEGSVSHILNQLHADTHLQVGQYLNQMYGKSYLPMAPNSGFLRIGQADIPGFLDSNFSYIEGGMGIPLRPALQPYLNRDIEYAIDRFSDFVLTTKIEDGKKVQKHFFRGLLRSIVGETWEADLAKLGTNGLVFASTKTAEAAYTQYLRFENRVSSVFDLIDDEDMRQEVTLAVATVLRKGTDLINQRYNIADGTISQYSLLDYFMYGDNIAKEFQAGSDIRIGRMQHLDPTSELTDLMASPSETLPAMDQELLSAVNKLKGVMANHGRMVSFSDKEGKAVDLASMDVEDAADFFLREHENVGEVAEKVGSARSQALKSKDLSNQKFYNMRVQTAVYNLVSHMLAPDMYKLYKQADGTVDFLGDTPSLEAAMETLGWHADLLANTNRKGVFGREAASLKLRIQLGHYIWDTPRVMTQLNQSIMVNTLHQLYVKGRSHQKIAEEIDKVSEKYPAVAALMRAAAESGATNGTVGARVRKAEVEVPVDPVAVNPEAISFTPKPAQAEFLGNMQEEMIKLNPDGPGARQWRVDAQGNVSIDTEDARKAIVEELKIRIKELDDMSEGARQVLTKNFEDLIAEVEAATLAKAGVVAKAQEAAPIPPSVSTPNVPEGDPNNSQLSPLAKQQMEWAHRKGVKFKDLHYDETGAKCPKCFPPRKTRTVEAPQPAAVVEAVTPPAPTPTPGEEVIAAKDSAEITPLSEANVPDPKPVTQVAQQSVTATQEATKAAVTAPNAPGGMSAPQALTDVEVEQIALFEKEMHDVDVQAINNAIANMKSNMEASMHEFNANMMEKFGNYQIKTGRMLRVAGMPIMPLPAFTSPMHSYAGVVASYEEKSRVGNWLSGHVARRLNNPDIYEKEMTMRRPGKGLNPVMNDIRRSSSNNAQQRIVAIHGIIRETYQKYETKAKLKADKMVFWDASRETPEIFKDVEERLSIITDHHTVWADTGKKKSQRTTAATARAFNRALPKKYRIPREYEERIFGAASGSKATEFKSVHPIYSRHWLIDLSNWLDKTSLGHHRLAASNISKLNMGEFEFALQEALSKIELSNELHASMFDHFTVKMDPATVAKFNEGAVEADQFVRLDSVFRDKTSRYIEGEYKNNYVRKGIADEMLKVTRFVDHQMESRVKDFNFETGARINNYWKSMVTTWNIPKYHIANVMADGFLNSMDGVGLTSYRKASTIMAHSHEFRRRMGKYAENGIDIQTFMRPEMTLDMGDISRELAEIGNPNRARHISTIYVNGKAHVLDSEQLVKAYVDYGLSQTQVNGNLLRSSAATGANSKAKQFYQTLTDGVLDLSNAREDYFRMAHFIHAIESEAKMGHRTMDEVLVAARDRVIKYHFDYGDVSEIERISVARYIPFYKWTRNIVPLAMNQLFTNPRTYSVATYANQAMGDLLYPTQEDSATGAEIPVSYITPEWVGDANMVPIGTYMDPEGNEQARYAVLNLPLDQALASWIMPLIDPFLDPNKSSNLNALAKAGQNTTITALAASNPIVKFMMQSAGVTALPGGETMSAGLTDPYKNISNTFKPLGSTMAVAEKDTKAGKPKDALWYADNLFGLIRENSLTNKSQLGQLKQDEDRLVALYKEAAQKWMDKNHPGVRADSEEGKAFLKEYHKSTGTITR